MSLIELEGIEKTYPLGDKLTYVLRDIDLEIGEGEFVSVMGPSGAGKSTLLHILGMLDNPTAGTYRFLGRVVQDLKERDRTELHRDNIGFVFQSYHLIDELNVYENLETPLLYKRVKSAERKALVSDTLDRFNIVGKKRLFPNQLSGGQQQLVAVNARCLAVNGQVVFDQPGCQIADGPVEKLVTGTQHKRAAVGPLDVSFDRFDRLALVGISILGRVSHVLYHDQLGLTLIVKRAAQL